MQRTLKNAGYDAQIAYNSARNMYRVVATTLRIKLLLFQAAISFVVSMQMHGCSLRNNLLLSDSIWFMGRILSIDYGKKRTGLAVTDPMQIIANGLTTVSQ